MFKSSKNFIKKIIRFILRTRIIKLIKSFLPYHASWLKASVKKKLAYRHALSSKDKISTLKNAEKYIDKHDVISLDIFDTLISRHVHPPAVPFSQGGFAAEIILRHVNRDITHIIYNRKRDKLIHAHRRKYFNKGFDDEYKINDVLKETLKALKIPTKDLEQYADKLLANEIRRECETLYVMNDVVEFLELCKSRNKKVIAVSDMYFSETEIEMLLESHHLLHYFDQVYVSSEYKLAKHSGKLFRHIMKDMKVEGKRIMHVGDNIISDVIAPRKCGIFSLWLNNPGVVARKSNIAGYYHRERNFAKHVNKSIKEMLFVKKERSFEDFVNNHLALDFCNFVFDMLYKAYSEGIDIIYFLERDGTIFCHLAQLFQDKLALFHGAKKIEFKKAAISRRKSAALVDYDCPDTIIARASRILNSDSFSILDILGTFGINESSLSEKLQKHIAKHNNSKKYFLRIYDKILKPVIKERRDVIVGYLDELKVFECQKFGIVDIGWGGTIQKDMADYLNKYHPAIKCFGFYYGTDQRAYELDDYYPSTTFQPGYINSNYIIGSYSAVEFFVQDYSTADTKFKNHISEETLVLNAKSRETILKFAHEFAHLINKNAFLPWEIAGVSQPLAIKFFTNPPLALLKKIKNVEFSLDRKNGDCGIPLVNRISLLRYRSEIKKSRKLCQWDQACIKQNYVLYNLKKIKNFFRRYFFSH